MENLLAINAAWAADIAFVLLVAFGAVSGWRKGVVKSLIGVVSLAVAVASVIPGGWIARAGDSMFGLSDFFAGKCRTLFLKVDGFDADISAIGAERALEGVALPAFIKQYIASRAGGALAAGTTLADVIAPDVGMFVSRAVFAAGFFILVRGVLLIVQRIKNWGGNGGGAVDSALGLAFGMLEMLFLGCMIMTLLSFIPLPGVSAFFDKTWFLKSMYYDNPLTPLIGKIIPL